MSTSNPAMGLVVNETGGGGGRPLVRYGSAMLSQDV